MVDRFGLAVRAAGTMDGPQLAEVARASSLGEHDSGADPHYVEHLRNHGHLVIAEDGVGAALGYAATVPVGDRRMLTDLFVRPDRQGGGVGRALLTAVLPDSGPVMTFSSQDPRAVTLYARHGMSAQWPLLYLRGDPRVLGVPTGFSVDEVPAGTAAAVEQSITGLDRTTVYEFWARRPDASAVVVSVAGRDLAAGAVGGGGDEYGVSHLSCRSRREAAQATIAVLARLPKPARICLPGTHPAVTVLLADGFIVADFDLFMTTGPTDSGPPGAFSPALY